MNVCPRCGLDDPTWDHADWHRRMKRAEERELEREMERDEARRKRAGESP